MQTMIRIHSRMIPKVIFINSENNNIIAILNLGGILV